MPPATWLNMSVNVILTTTLGYFLEGSFLAGFLLKTFRVSYSVLNSGPCI